MEIKRLPLEELKNTRDFAGFPTEDGRHIKPCRLIRSGELYGAARSDLTYLVENIHLKKILDFRTTKEREEHPDPVLSGVINLHLPVLDEKALGVTREGQDGDMMEQLVSYLESPDFNAENYMAGIYEQIILGEKAHRCYGRMFDELLSQDEGAVLWHCTAGKDRAGIASILILSALEVPKEIIEADYFRVNALLKEDNERLCDDMEKRLGMQGIRQGLMAMFSVHKEYLDCIYRVIENKYTDMNNYLEEILGLTKDKRKVLKDLYLEA